MAFAEQPKKVMTKIRVDILYVCNGCIIRGLLYNLSNKTAINPYLIYVMPLIESHRQLIFLDRYLLAYHFSIPKCICGQLCCSHRKTDWLAGIFRIERIRVGSVEGVKYIQTLYFRGYF